MEFDSFTIGLLIERDDPAQYDAQKAAEIQDAHLANLAALKEQGQLLAAGPLRNERYCGLSIFGVDADETQRLMHDDPLVRAGICALEVIPWLVPAGVIAFPPGGRLPRSIAETEA